MLNRHTHSINNIVRLLLAGGACQHTLVKVANTGRNADLVVHAGRFARAKLIAAVVATWGGGGEAGEDEGDEFELHVVVVCLIDA